MTAATKRRHRIVVQQLAAGQDAAGQPVQTWSTVANLWADIRQLSGLAAIKAGADTSTVKASIRVCYWPSASAGMRVVHGSTVYDIQAVTHDVAQKRHTDLVCLTGVSNG